ncbi:MAG: hypothetical protein V1848_03135 [Candidatus Magasanikbacteria bacterium]
MQKTSYGKKQLGHSEFIIIAPHAAGDDKKTGVLARHLGKKLDAFIIINKRFFKEKNSKAKKFPERIEDFNKLRWNYTTKKYAWRRKKPEMKEFYKDIKEYSKLARQQSKNKRAFCIHLHGTQSESIGIDIGAGTRYLKEKKNYVGSGENGNNLLNSGKTTITPLQLYTLQKELEKELQKTFPLMVTIGKYFPGWSKQSAIQFHKNEGRDDSAIQLEINNVLRSNTINIRYITDLLAKKIKQIAYL